MRRTTPWLMAALLALLTVPAIGCGSDDSPGGSAGSGGAGATGGAGGTAGTGGTGGGGGSGGSGGSGGVVDADVSDSDGGTGGNSGMDSGTDGPVTPTSEVHRVGRFDESDPNRPTASWSGTMFRTRVSGTSLSVSLGGAANVIFQVEVDGQPTGKIVTSGGDQGYDIATGLAAGEHDVAIVRRNEGFFGDVSFLGFEPGAGAALVPTPWPYVHTLELVGDSLTAGYGIEGASENCSFSGETESFYSTYGAIAARNVGAAVHGIAYSGKGVFQNYGGDTNELMPELWRRTLTNDPASAWDFSRFTPEAVVVNLGTNDFSVAIDESGFVDAYSGLLGEIRAEYADAMIFCVTWASWGAGHESLVLDAMAATGDPNLRHLAFSIDPADGLGCDYHTNVVTNAKLGEQLTQALHDELGW